MALYVFDWCQCPLSVFEKMKTDPLLISLLWSQNQFIVVDMVHQNKDQNIQWFIEDLQEGDDTVNKYIMIISNVQHPGFYANDEFRIVNHMIHPTLVSDRLEKVRLPPSLTESVYFTVFAGKAVPPMNSQVDVVYATVHDLYYIYAGSSAPNEEYKDNVNDCYLARYYAGLVQSFKEKSMFVVKYKGQVLGYLNFAMKGNFLVKDRSNINRMNEQYKQHGFDMSHIPSLQACFVQTMCSFSRWQRLHQEQALWGVGKMLWLHLLRHVSSLFPNDYIIVYNWSVNNAVPFHSKMGMILNEKLPLLQYLHTEYPLVIINTYHFMYYIVEGNAVLSLEEQPTKRHKSGEETKLEGGASTHKKTLCKSRLKSKSRSRPKRRQARTSRSRSRSRLKRRQARNSRSRSRSRPERRQARNSRSRSRSRPKRRQTRDSRSRSRSRPKRRQARNSRLRSRSRPKRRQTRTSRSRSRSTLKRRQTRDSRSRHRK